MSSKTIHIGAHNLLSSTSQGGDGSVNKSSSASDKKGAPKSPGHPSNRSNRDGGGEHGFRSLKGAGKGGVKRSASYGHKAPPKSPGKGKK